VQNASELFARNEFRTILTPVNNTRAVDLWPLIKLDLRMSAVPYTMAENLRRMFL